MLNFRYQELIFLLIFINKCPAKHIGNFLNQKNDLKNFLHKSCTKSDKNLAVNLALNLTKMLHKNFEMLETQSKTPIMGVLGLFSKFEQLQE